MQTSGYVSRGCISRPGPCPNECCVFKTIYLLAGGAQSIGFSAVSPFVLTKSGIGIRAAAAKNPATETCHDETTIF